MQPTDEIEIRQGETTVRTAPARGALVTSVVVDGKDLLTLDRRSFEETHRHVRGGIPILFPFSGALKDGTLVASGTQMPQHGFAREKAWDVVSQSESEMVLGLSDDEATRAVYPWPFRLTYTVRALDRGVEVVLTARNLGDSPMPTSPGWHPYFPLPVEAKPEFATSVEGAGGGTVTNDREINFGVPSPPGSKLMFQLPGTGFLEMEYSESMEHLQIWSLPRGAFVCVEPWDGGVNDINTPGATVIAPGEMAEWRMAFRLNP